MSLANDKFSGQESEKSNNFETSVIIETSLTQTFQQHIYYFLISSKAFGVLDAGLY